MYSAVESDRFGLRVFRHVAEDLDIDTLRQAIFEQRADLVILRLPSAQQHRLGGLDRAGLPYVVADTLVHYVSDVTKPSDLLRNEGLHLEEIDLETLPVLDSLVREIFPGYSNHYNSNRILPLGDVLDGYVEWAQSYATGEDTVAYLVKSGDDVLGFATCRFDQSADTSEGVLYGVRPEAAGGGVYTDIIRLTRDVSRERGFDKMTVSTQTQNLAVQKAWIRSGFTLLHSEVTVHINSLLSASEVPERESTITASAELSALYADTSGDFNPLHANDEFARERGFSGAFAHGLLANAVLSKEFGMHYPGPGTVFLGYRYSFLRPLYLGQDYRLRLRFPVISKSGYHLAVAEIDDGNGTCLLAYCDLINKQPNA